MSDLSTDFSNTQPSDSMEFDSFLDEMLSTTAAMLKGIKWRYSEFQERFLQIQTNHDKLLVQALHYKELQARTNKLIEEEQSKQQDLRHVIEKNNNYLKELESKVAKGNEERDERERELIELQNQQKDEKNHFAFILKQKEEIRKKKDEILACKLLTKADFMYSAKKVVGYMSGVDGLKSFCFNPESLSQEEIRDKLWQLAGEAGNINK